MTSTDATVSLVKDHAYGRHGADHPQCPVCGFRAIEAIPLGAEHTERLRGIGAQDTDRIETTIGGGVPFMTTAGWLHAEARREAAWERGRAFDRIPAYATLTPAGNHVYGATEAELRLGCPAWSR